MFKLLVLAVALVAHASADQTWGNIDDHPGMRKVQGACQKAVPVDKDIYARAETGDFQKDNAPLQEYMKCVFTKAGVMDKDGKLEMTKFIAGMKPEAAVFYGPKFLLCQGMIDDKDINLKSLRLYECFRDQFGPMYYFV